VDIIDYTDRTICADTRTNNTSATPFTSGIVWLTAYTNAGTVPSCRISHIDRERLSPSRDGVPTQEPAAGQKRGAVRVSKDTCSAPVPTAAAPPDPYLTNTDDIVDILRHRSEVTPLLLSAPPPVIAPSQTPPAPLGVYTWDLQAFPGFHLSTPTDHSPTELECNLDVTPSQVANHNPVISPSQAAASPAGNNKVMAGDFNCSQEACQATASTPPEATPPPVVSTLETTQTSTDTGQHSAAYLRIFDVVRASRLPNYLGARVPLPHGLHMPAWRYYLRDYVQDLLLCDFLEFGWPISYAANQPPTPADAKHASAWAYPRDIETYLDTERAHGAILGPFSQTPFQPWFQTNALMTRPKKTSEARRVIMDLSWPHSLSVNDGVTSGFYCGVPYKLQLPTVDDAIALIQKHGPGCFLYSVDLARAYRQLRSDPLDFPLLGFAWDQDYYIDVSIPFGIRWGAMACQRTTNGIRYIQERQSRDTLNYIDDFLGVESTQQEAQAASSGLQQLLVELGVEESASKFIAPTTCLPWIGIEFDTVAMEVRMPQHKIDATLALLQQWRHLTRATRQQLRKLLGKLFHIGHTCKPVRLCVSRMLHTLRGAPATGYTDLSDCFQRDVTWFMAFLPSYNGRHLLDASPPSFSVEVDSCLSGCGGLTAGEYYHTGFPDFVLRQDIAISQLEMLNIVITVKLWHHHWEHSHVRIHCDNAAAVSVLNTGRGRDPFLLKCAREVWLLSALHDFQVEIIHTPGALISSADALSRYHLHPHLATQVNTFTAGTLDLPGLRQAMLRRRGQAFRPGTTANHISQFRMYISFCIQFKLRDVNPSVDVICLFVEYLAQRFRSPQSVRNYVSGVRLLHKYLGITCPSLYSFELDLMLRALDITLVHVPNQRLPLTPGILQQLCQICDGLGTLGRVVKCALLFGFFGLLRQSNLAPSLAHLFDPRRHTCRGDVLFHHPGIVIILKGSKTAQTGGQPHLIPLPAISNSPLCPVATYQAMLQVAPTRHPNDALLFTLSPAGQARLLTIPQLRQSFNIMMDTLGYHAPDFSLHSLRRGGASAAYQAGVDYTLIQRHGAWKSDAFWNYIAPTATVYACLPQKLAEAALSS
jgi:hypothetical protein